MIRIIRSSLQSAPFPSPPYDANDCLCSDSLFDHGDSWSAAKNNQGWQLTVAAAHHDAAQRHRDADGLSAPHLVPPPESKFATATTLKGGDHRHGHGNALGISLTRSGPSGDCGVRDWRCARCRWVLHALISAMCPMPRRVTCSPTDRTQRSRRCPGGTARRRSRCGLIVDQRCSYRDCPT